MVDKMLSVYEAWAAVMADVQSIEKGEFNKEQGFKFRGIDAVMDVVGPALRRHGVIVVPTATDLHSETYATSKGTQMRNVTATMCYRVYGPGGDYFEGTSYGEAADAGDKAVTKAQSVALRTFLLQALMVPTGDVDPDSASHERATAPRRPEPEPAKPRSPADEARAELLEVCKANGLDARAVGARFASEFGMPIAEADVQTIQAFKQMLVDEAAGPV